MSNTKNISLSKDKIFINTFGPQHFHVLNCSVKRLRTPWRPLPAAGANSIGWSPRRPHYSARWQHGAKCQHSLSIVHNVSETVFKFPGRFEIFRTSHIRINFRISIYLVAFYRRLPNFVNQAWIHGVRICSEICEKLFFQKIRMYMNYHRTRGALAVPITTRYMKVQFIYAHDE